MTAGRQKFRRGFTLIETLIASTIGALALAAVVSVFIIAWSMLSTAMAESELSLALREMRDKLLFKVTPDIGGQHYAGLRSRRTSAVSTTPDCSADGS